MNFIDSTFFSGGSENSSEVLVDDQNGGQPVATGLSGEKEVEETLIDVAENVSGEAAETEGPSCGLTREIKQEQLRLIETTNTKDSDVVEVNIPDDSVIEIDDSPSTQDLFDLMDASPKKTTETQDQSAAPDVANEGAIAATEDDASNVTFGSPVLSSTPAVQVDLNEENQTNLSIDKENVSPSSSPKTVNVVTPGSSKKRKAAPSFGSCDLPFKMITKQVENVADLAQEINQSSNTRQLLSENNSVFLSSQLQAIMTDDKQAAEINFPPAVESMDTGDDVEILEEVELMEEIVAPRPVEIVVSQSTSVPDMSKALVEVAPTAMPSWISADDDAVEVLLTVTTGPMPGESEETESETTRSTFQLVKNPSQTTGTHRLQFLGDIKLKDVQVNLLLDVSDKTDPKVGKMLKNWLTKLMMKDGDGFDLILRGKSVSRAMRVNNLNWSGIQKILHYIQQLGGRNRGDQQIDANDFQRCLQYMFQTTSEFSTAVIEKQREDEFKIENYRSEWSLEKKTGENKSQKDPFVLLDMAFNYKMK